MLYGYGQIRHGIDQGAIEVEGDQLLLLQNGMHTGSLVMALDDIITINFITLSACDYPYRVEASMLRLY
ncbi:hypothetical protein GCM10007157_15280 [Vreelandella hamiltonii]|uniref:Uncharacterized protein n=1 Tax=Vreelandella hamiltonii TaxID=502829 RepID=A0A8H9LZI0_9GAMM|nr:hypothetical protein GCM10007157_15280 [Halomonas hamiltonii]